tara:strand:+ start:757 stop:1053 length:297 start_codon:yes stop_codon:yes gene_type:complete
MGKIVGIENWSIVEGNKLNPYQAPELQTIKIHGEVYGHPDFEDGKEVTTSTVIKREGRFINTRNTRYHLGYPSMDYTAYCVENNLNIWKIIEEDANGH